MKKIPFIPVQNEYESASTYFKLADPFILSGPTGCGKTTLIEELCKKENSTLTTLICSPDMTLRHLVGGYNLEDGSTIWKDGPLTKAVREGLVFYMDEIDLAPPELLAIIHPLLDFRKKLYLAPTSETINAAEGFRFIASYSPRATGNGTLPTAFRQRCRFISMGYLPEEAARKLLCDQSGIPESDAQYLLQTADCISLLHDSGLPEAGTRTLLSAAGAINAGLDRETAVMECIVLPLTDDLRLRALILEQLSIHGIFDEDNMDKLCSRFFIPLPEPDFSDDDFFEDLELVDDDDDDEEIDESDEHSQDKQE